MGSKDEWLDGLRRLGVNAPLWAGTMDNNGLAVLYFTAALADYCEKEGFTEVVMTATGVSPRQWLREGWQWGDRVAQPPFPCFMKAIARSAPPPRPVGLQRCSDDARGRWEADSFRFPPYQCRGEHMMWRNGRWRTIDSSERELLMGFGFEHTSLCWGATAIKSDLQSYEDTRKTLVGDSFWKDPTAAMGYFLWTEL